MAGYFPSSDDLETQRLKREADAIEHATVASDALANSKAEEAASFAAAAGSLVPALAEFASKASAGIAGASWTVMPPTLQYSTAHGTHDAPIVLWWPNYQAGWFVQAVCAAQRLEYQPPPKGPDERQFYRRRFGRSRPELDKAAFDSARSSFDSSRDEWVARYAQAVEASPSIVLFKTERTAYPGGRIYSWVLYARAGFYWISNDSYDRGDWDHVARIERRAETVGVYHVPDDLKPLAEDLVHAHLQWDRDEPLQAGTSLAEHLSSVAHWGAE